MNSKWCLKQNGRMWAGFIWLTIWPSGRLLLTNVQGIEAWGISWPVQWMIKFQTMILLHEVVWILTANVIRPPPHPSQKWIWKSNSNITRNVFNCYNSFCCLICLQKENKNIEGKSTERCREEKQELWEDEAESRKTGWKGTESIEETKRKDEEQPWWYFCHATQVCTLCV